VEIDRLVAADEVRGDLDGGRRVLDSTLAGDFAA
jgi:hypothetical protein